MMLDGTVVFLAYVIGCGPFLLMLAGMTGSVDLPSLGAPPLYLCMLLLIWANLELSADGLLFKLLWTAWIVVGAILEERDLAAEMGPAYRAYCRRVPMLIPWRQRVAVDFS